MLIFLAMAAMARCASTVSRSELDNVSHKIRSGDEQTLEDLFKRRRNVPDAEKDRYVEVIAQEKSDRSSVMLQELYRSPEFRNQRSGILKELIERKSESNAQFVRRSLAENPEVFSEELERALLRRADRASAETLLSMIEAGRTTLKPESIRLFGETSLKQALPLLIQHADEGSDTSITLQAIARIPARDASQYILDTAKKENHPAQLDAIRQLTAVPDQNEARTLLHSLIKHDPEAQLAALETLSGMGYNEESYALVSDLYYRTEDEAIRRAALETMAAMRQIDPEDLAAEMKELRRSKDNAEKNAERRKKDQRSLKDAYREPGRLTDIIRDQKQKKPKGIEEKPSTVIGRALYRLDESDSASDRYVARLNQSFRRLFKEDADEVRLRIHNALLACSSSKSNSAAFVQRSYQKAFGVDQDRSEQLLKRGLRLQHSLDAVLASIIREYERKDLQIYALSSFFAIKRKQAEVLLDAHRKRSL